MSEQRAVPFYCPFCGEEDLRPAIPDENSTAPGTARSCTRVFSLKLVGLVVKT